MLVYDFKTIGNRLLAIRKKAGMTQTEVAEAMHITRETLRNWENKITCPSKVQYDKLLELYNVPYNSIKL